jgi:hypothetical protein
MIFALFVVLQARTKHIFLFLAATVALIFFVCFSSVCYVSLGPSVAINSALLKGDANLSVGVIVHNVKIGQRLLGDLMHTYHKYGLLSRANSDKNY